ncbi:unnamed protein product [Urochloa humidicola]
MHLRFEEDMVNFSCCVFDGSDNEKELDAARENRLEREVYKARPCNKAWNNQDEWEMSTHTFGGLGMETWLIGLKGVLALALLLGTKHTRIIAIFTI